jgi:N-acetylneuraminic acid mutarotase
VPPPSTGFTQINWAAVAPALFPTAEAFNAVLDGKLYVFGGFSGTNGAITGPVAWSEVYDPATNTWRRLADFPRRWSHVGAATDGRYAYFAGAYVGTGTGFQQTFASKEVFRYDPRTDGYTRLPDLPEARGSGGLVLLGRDLHFFGGADIPARADRGEHWVLNLDSGTTWRAAAPMPNPRTHFGAVALNGKIYALGGERNHDENLIPQNTTQVYDPATDRWTALAPMPRAVNHIAGSTDVYQGRVLVLGGQEQHDQSIADCYAYDPATNRWTTLNPLPGRRFSGLAAVIGNDIYFTQGSGLTTTWRGRPVV